MRFELFIATRYLRAKRRQAFIGIITGISIVGVAAGVASLIVALAINNGFRQDLQERLIGSTSHVSLLRIADDGMRIDESMCFIDGAGCFLSYRMSRPCSNTTLLLSQRLSLRMTVIRPRAEDALKWASTSR